VAAFIPEVPLDPFEIREEAEITAAGVQRIRKGHLWVYAADVKREPEGASPAIVKVIDSHRNALGYAFYSRVSQIRLRMLSRGADEPSIDLLRSRVQKAIARRGAQACPNSACRLVFGEADLLPSIVVDRYAGCLVLQTLSAGADAVKSQLVDILRDSLNPVGILERNDVKTRRFEGLEELHGPLWGTILEEVEIIESGIRFLVDLSAGQKTGFFLDQRENRVAARAYASGRGLDCFTNTGAFALHFSGRCSSVLAVDVSDDSLRQARRNSELNGMANIEFREANVFDLLRELERAGEKFDLVCLDPPAFAKNRSSLPGALAGYKEINLRAMKLLRPEGILVTSSCSFHFSEANFGEILQGAALDAHRYVQILERRGQASDHPILAGMPETHYLKCFILRVL
jgi:23S rRNA (cytosine1962-C5)-methyltransferase